mgnify:CR=1 FL=1
MDKFGIYNLLNSFLGAFSAPKPENGAPTPDRAPAGNENASAPPAVFPPLQAGMLSVMREHDEFIKRVKAKSGENKR